MAITPRASALIRMKPRLATCLAVLFAGTLMPANAQPAVSPYNLKAAFAAERWQVNDITFTARNAEGTDPFAVEFGALYTGPTGEIMKVPRFYDGNDTWVSRFSSDRVGEWTFNTYSSHADLSGQVRPGHHHTQYPTASTGRRAHRPG